MRSEIPPEATAAPCQDPVTIPPLPAPSAGRPRLWNSPQARQQAAGKRRTERGQLLNELYLALLNAHWEDPELQRVLNRGTEPEIIRALTAYFRRRHWSLPRSTAPEAVSTTEAEAAAENLT